MVLRDERVAEMNCFTALLSSSADTGAAFICSTSASMASRAATNLSASTVALRPNRPGAPGL